jgi:hypothetical protein
VRVLLAVTFLLASSSWCGTPAAAKPPDEPVDAYLAFVRSVRKGDVKQAYGQLSTDTRALLEMRAEVLSTASGGTLKKDPAALFFTAGPQQGADVDEVKLVNRTDTRATVNAKAGKQEKVIALVKEADGWKVDLTEQLRQ